LEYNFLLTFLDNLSIGYPKTSVRVYHSMLCKIPKRTQISATICLS